MVVNFAIFLVQIVYFIKILFRKILILTLNSIG
jgi:hypothetical protein